jgi:hypothetical protein
MLMMLESLVADIMLFSPEYIMLFGAPELPRLRAKRFFTVRQGRHSALVEA